MAPGRIYIAYGIPVETDLDLAPWLVPHGGVGEAVRLLAEPSPAEPFGGGTRFPIGIRHGRRLVGFSFCSPDDDLRGHEMGLEISGIARFWWMVDSPTREVRYELLNEGDLELLAFWLIHWLLPLYLSLEARYNFIHASAVEIGSATALLLAPSGGGKSTLTDRLLSRGASLVSDDKVGSYSDDGCCYAVPSHPRHRPYRRFEDLGRRTGDFDPAPRPIAAVFLLNRAAPTSAVRTAEVVGLDKFEALKPSYLFELPYLRERHFQHAAQLSNTTRVFSVRVPWDLERLDAVCDAIEKQLADAAGSSLQGQPPGTQADVDGKVS